MKIYSRVLVNTFGTVSLVALVRFTSLEELLKANSEAILIVQLGLSVLAGLLLILGVGRVTSRR